MALLDQLADKMLIGDGCWEWTGAKFRGGYASLRFEGRAQYVHRLVYELLKGEIPEDFELDHLCRNTSCVRPDHLEPVSHRTNIHRGDVANRRKTCCPEGHVYDSYSGGKRRCRTCDRERQRLRRPQQTVGGA